MMEHSLTRISVVSYLPLTLMVAATIGGALGSSDYKWYCAIGSQPALDVVWSEEAKSYVVWDGNHSTSVDIGNPSGDDGERRKLHEGETWFEDGATNHDTVYANRSLRGNFSQRNTVYIDSGKKIQRAILLPRRTLGENASSFSEIRLEGDEEIMKVAQVRRCPCWSSLTQDSIKDFYCPAARTHCGLAAGYGDLSLNESDVQHPACLNVSQQETFARNIWPVITIW